MSHPPEFERMLMPFMEKYHRARQEIAKVVVGLDDLIRDVFVAALGRGHLLVESAPGLGKTTMLETVAAAVDAKFAKMVFNADMTPSDLTHIVSPHEIGLRIDPGPLLGAEIFFANELNRGIAQTQNALMSAMEEGVSAYRGELVRLPPFRLVVADINPVETTGTNQIPEALAERFLVKAYIHFPDPEMLAKITATSEHRKMYDVVIEKVFSPQELLDLAREIYQWYAPQAGEHSWLVGYAGRLVSWIRGSDWMVPGVTGEPASPSVRGVEDLKTVARLYAFFDESPLILPRHIKRAAHPALRGKFFLNRQAMMENLTHDKIIDMALDAVPIVTGYLS